MNCALFERQVPHWVSGELDPATSVAMDAHSIECADCEARVVFERETRSLIHEAGRGPAAPAHLRERILAELPLEAFPAQETSNGLRAWHLAPLAAAAVALLATIPFLSTRSPNAPPPGQTAPMMGAASLGLLQDAVRVHNSALPADVQGQAPHTVSHYFRDKVRFRVQPARFAQDTQFVGARLSHLGSRRAAALFYRVNGERVTVMVVDEPFSSLQPIAQPWNRGPHRVYYRNVRGHVVPIRERHGLTYIFTGDLNRRAMLELAASADVDQ